MYVVLRASIDRSAEHISIDRGWRVHIYTINVDILLTVDPRLTLGGGFGHLSGRHGLVIDNLVQVSQIAPI